MYAFFIDLFLRMAALNLPLNTKILNAFSLSSSETLIHPTPSRYSILFIISPDKMNNFEIRVAHVLQQSLHVLRRHADGLDDHAGVLGAGLHVLAPLEDELVREELLEAALLAGVAAQQLRDVLRDQRLDGRHLPHHQQLRAHRVQRLEVVGVVRCGGEYFTQEGGASSGGEINDVL